MDNMLKQAMIQLLITLAKASEAGQRQAIVVGLRFGINEKNRQYTLEEIGHELNLTRERIRQIEEKGLRKIWQLLNKNPELKQSLAEFLT